METEIWKDIPNYEGYYQVSNLGKIKSLIRYRSNTEKILKSRVNKRGYAMINLYKNGKYITFEIHRLLAIAFLGHVPCKMKRVINHIDGDKLNNTIDNIEIKTHRENVSKCFRKDRNTKSSIYTGVCFHKKSKKWVSNIFINGKLNSLGYFENEIDAANAYNNKLLTI